MPPAIEKGWTVCILVALIMAVAAVRLTQGLQSTAAGSDKRPNVLLISIDTLRADHMGCYGSPRDTTPVIDEFAKQAIRYANAYAPSPWTLPSHAAMLTGRHHVEVGVLTGDDSIPDSTPMLAEPFAQDGYQTVAFVDSAIRGFVGGARGFARGFEEYHHAPYRTGLRFKYDMAVTVDEAVKWFQQRDKTRPFFMFLHTKSVHATPDGTRRSDNRYFPYDKPDPYRFRFVRDEDAQFTWSDPVLGNGIKYLQAVNRRLCDGLMKREDFPKERIEVLKGLYDAGIYYVDEHLGRLLRKLEELKFTDNTIIVLTADHGEEFLEHNQLIHVELYNELLHVPLIIHLPNDTARRVIHQDVALEDVAPTILDLAGLGIPEVMSGRRLPLDSTERPKLRALFSQATPNKRYSSLALREGDWKLIVHNFARPNNPQYFLYNVKDDPHEQAPVTDQPDRVESMRQRLLNWQKDAPRQKGPKTELDEKTIEHLKSLGYLE